MRMDWVIYNDNYNWHATFSADPSGPKVENMIYPYKNKTVRLSDGDIKLKMYPCLMVDTATNDFAEHYISYAFKGDNHFIFHQSYNDIISLVALVEPPSTTLAVQSANDLVTYYVLRKAIYGKPCYFLVFFCFCLQIYHWGFFFKVFAHLLYLMVTLIRSLSRSYWLYHHQYLDNGLVKKTKWIWAKKQLFGVRYKGGCI